MENQKRAIVLSISPPSHLDAKKIEHLDSGEPEDNYRLRFYKGRKHSYGPTIVVEQDGEVLDRVSLKIGLNGKINLERLTEEIFPE